MENTHKQPQQQSQQSQGSPRPLTSEERLKRRKEKARIYSKIARQRQGAYVNELKANLEVLMVYHYMIEEAGPEMVICLSPDLHAQVLYINSLVTWTLNIEPAALIGR